MSELVTRVANGRTDDKEKYLEIYNTKSRKIKAALAVSRNVHLVSSSLVPRRSEEEFGKNAIS